MLVSGALVFRNELRKLISGKINVEISKVFCNNFAKMHLFWQADDACGVVRKKAQVFRRQRMFVKGQDQDFTRCISMTKFT